MSYVKLFDPAEPPGAANGVAGPSRRLGDRVTDGASAGPTAVYEYDDNIVLAINVALAAGRPLLVRGDPGTGKSSLARSVAQQLGWRYYATTVSSRSTARDLQWTFDTVARLADAQAGTEHTLPRSAYLTPGVLWWAFDGASARRRGMAEADFSSAVAQGQVSPAIDPAGLDDSPRSYGPDDRVVVLIDEIDKADPDVPNDLLMPLGSFQFAVEDGPSVVAQAAPLVIITTNEERDLPKAFLRRCVVLALEEPTPERLGKIARLHFPAVSDETLTPLITAYQRVRTERGDRGDIPPSVAEFLDAVAACRQLKSGPDAAEWPGFAALLLDKAPGPGGQL